MKIFCKQCEKAFKTYPSRQAKFCSVACSQLGHERKGRPAGTPAWNKGLKGFRAGEKRPNARMPKGEENIKWAGDSVKYRALHMWVERQLGKPSECSNCSVIAYGHGMHWANKSQDYKRDVSDWLRLCAKCHVSYDKGKLILN